MNDSLKPVILKVEITLNELSFCSSSNAGVRVLNPIQTSATGMEPGPTQTGLRERSLLPRGDGHPREPG